MLPRKTTKDGLAEDHNFKFLVLEDTASRSQKAFTAYDRHVAVCPLLTGLSN